MFDGDPIIRKLKAEIARLQESKRHFSALADAKGKENVVLRAENARLQGIIENMREIRTTRDLEQT